MFEYRITSAQVLSEGQKQDIWKMLVLADREFVPPLSERNSTLQKNLEPVEHKDAALPFAYFEQLLNQRFLLVLDEEAVVGFMSYIPEHEITGLDDKKIIADYVSTVIVHPDYRSKGITKALYHFLMEEKAEGYIATRTWSTNGAHLRILEKMGFENIHTIKDDRGAGIDTVYYCKKR